MFKDHMKHAVIIGLAIAVAISLPQVRDALAQTVTCPPGYTCTPVTTTPVPTIPTNTSTDATVSVASSSLYLSYSKGDNESLLTATFFISVNGGTNGINVYQSAGGGDFYDQASTSANLNSLTAANLTVLSSGITSSVDNYGQSYFVIPAGKTVNFSVAFTANPQQMFAGVYHASLVALLVNNTKDISNEFDLYLPTNYTNSKVIVGEQGPYISSIGGNPGTYAPGQSMTLVGQRLTNSVPSVDGITVNTGVSTIASALKFTLPSNLTNGQHTVYVVDPKTGQSNTVAFQVGNSTTPTPVNPPVTTPVQSGPIVVASVDGQTPSACTTGTATSNAACITFVNLLKRIPDTSAGWYYANMSTAQVTSIITGSLEYKTKQGINQIFQSVLGRTPSNQELNDWYVRSEGDGYSLDLVRIGLGGAVSAGAKAPAVTLSVPLTGNAISDQNAQIFVNLLQRVPDTTSGWYYGSMSADQTRSTIIQSTEYQTKQKIITIFTNAIGRAPNDVELNGWYYYAEQHGYDTSSVQAALGGGTTDPQTNGPTITGAISTLGAPVSVNNTVVSYPFTFAFSVTAGNNPIYLSNTPSQLVSAAVRGSGSISLGSLSSNPANIAGDGSSYLIIPPGSTRTVTINGSVSGSGLVQVIINQLNYGTTPTNIQSSSLALNQQATIAATFGGTGSTGTTPVVAPTISNFVATLGASIITNNTTTGYAMSFSYTITAGNAPIYISSNPLIANGLSVTSNAGASLPVAGEIANPGNIAGDLNVTSISGYYIIPAGSSRTFTYNGTVTGAGTSPSLAQVAITQINYGISTSNLQASSITSGLNTLRVNPVLGAVPGTQSVPQVSATPVTTANPTTLITPVVTPIVSAPVTTPNQNPTVLNQPSQSAMNAALFTQLLHRVPDTTGNWYFATMSTDQARSIITSGIEYQTKQKIISIYNSVLGRSPTDAEINNWYSIAEQNGYNTNVVQAGLIASTTKQTSSVWDAVKSFLGFN